MAMTPARVVLTYRDYAALPNDGRRYEIHEGELSVTAAPGSKHQIVSANLFRALDAHVRSRGIAAALRKRVDPIDVGVSAEDARVSLLGHEEHAALGILRFQVFRDVSCQEHVAQRGEPDDRRRAAVRHGLPRLVRGMRARKRG